MIPLIVAVLLANMPPPPINPCGGKKAGDSCYTPRRTMGVCVESRCEKTEVDKDGRLATVTSDCLTCPMPATDGGAAAAEPSPSASEPTAAQNAPPPPAAKKAKAK